MKYKVVIAGDISKLEHRVQSLLDLGWLPQGGVSKNPNNEWAQAMVLPE